MFKFTIVMFAIIACAAAKPGFVAPLTYAAAPAAAPAAVVAAPAPFVTATSSQVIARNHNGIATAPFIAPVATRYAAAPLTYSAPLAYSAPFGYSAPLTYASEPVLL